jgi:hypothetical protein
MKTDHNIYIIRVRSADKSLIKLGYSSNILGRLKSYYYHNPLIELIGTFKADAVFEKQFHNDNKATVLNEWYDEAILDVISDEDVEYNDLPIMEALESVKQPTIYSSPRNISYRNLVEMVQEGHSIDNHSHNSEYYDVIKNTLKMYNKVWLDFCYANEMIANYNKNDSQLATNIYNSFELNKRYPIKEVKAILNVVYAQSGLNIKAKSTDLAKYMTVVNVRNNRGRFIKVISKTL